MPFARASSLDRLLQCHGSAVMGQADTRSDRAREAADWGTMVHAWKETGEVVEVGGRKNHPALFRRKLERSGVKREVEWPESLGIKHELALAVDPLCEYRSYEGDNKDAWKNAHNDRWLTGTADGYWLLFDALTVEDLKTGAMVDIEDYRYQLMAYALGVSRVIDYRRSINLVLNHWPRYPVMSRPKRTVRVVEPDELLAFEKRLIKLRDDIRRCREDVRNLILRPSEAACTWCPSRSFCPEYEGRLN